MSLQVKIIMAVITLALAFALGHYSVKSTTNTTTNTTKTDTDNTTKTNEHKKIIIIQTPDGTKTTTITDDTSTIANTDTNSISNTTSTTRVNTRKTLNLSALAVAPSLDDIRPTYGVSVTKEILGPMTVGVFALTNRTIGLSIGVNF